MNKFLFSLVTLCLAAQSALASYQQQAPAGYGGSAGYQQQQRKLAPMPQTYGQHAQQTSYGAPEQQQQHYESSSYEERAPAASSSYGKQASSYARPAPSSGYSAPASSGYAAAKPAAPRYEEPYHAPMPFAWGYDINDGYGGAQYHKESGDEYGKRTGSYGYTDAYGVYRQVDYVADEHGFRATIKTNEPGTANESPADVELHAYEPPSNYYAGSSYGSGNSYGASSPSYGAASAPAAKSSPYSAPAAHQSYSAPAQQQSYSAPAPRHSYGGSSQRASSYPAKQQSSYGSAPRPSYEQSAYAGSSIVPVYQKATAAAGAAKQVAAKQY